MAALRTLRSCCWKGSLQAPTQHVHDLRSDFTSTNHRVIRAPRRAEVAGAGWLVSCAAADEAAALGSRSTLDSTGVGNGGTLLLAASTGVLLGASSKGAAFARRWARSETCEPTTELRPTSLEGVLRGERCLRVLSRGVRSPPAGYAGFRKVAATTTKEHQVQLPSPA